jgi:UrcA family protein
MKRSLMLLTLVATAVSGPPANARGNDGITYQPATNGILEARISVGDLDLAKPDEQAMFLNRISKAVTTLCRAPLPEDVLLSGVNRLTRRCRLTTMESVKPALNVLVNRALRGDRMAMRDLRLAAH